MSENASHACQRRQLQKFSKDVIIEAILCTSFFRLDDVISECEIIQSDKKFKSLLSQGEKMSKQVSVLLNNKPGENVNELVEWMHILQQLNDHQNIIQNKIDKLLEI